MAAGSVNLRDLSSALASHGLALRGGFNFRDDESRPDGPDGSPGASVMLVGHLGGAIWPDFSSWLERQSVRPDEPLDHWSGEVIGDVAGRFDARAVFPWERPYWPFQQWAMRAERLKPSPLGMLIHPEAGLWHAYRGALVVDAGSAFPEVENPIHPCDGCVEKPCLTACPVEAFSPGGVDAAGCRSYLDAVGSQSDSTTAPDCMALGCRARDACPVGRDHRYRDAQVRFHMVAFARAG
ncbi:MAG: hypothetical protein VYD64_02875 [Pseudomonadota bacterium]|nr:hypothetical protein [Pseudomonadota bacterium]